MAQDRGGGLDVVALDGDRHAAGGLLEQGIDVTDIDFGREQGGANHQESRGGREFDGDDLGFAEGEVLVSEEAFGRIGVVANEANDGTIGRVDDAESPDFDGRAVKYLEQPEELPDAVFEKDGQLADGRRGRPLGGLKGTCCHGGHSSGLQVEPKQIFREIRGGSECGVWRSGVSGFDGLVLGG